MKKVTKYINDTHKPVPLYEGADGEKLFDVPPNGGMAKIFTEAQIRSQTAYASRVQYDWKFIKCMENEQEIIILLKDDLKTFYALTVMKHFLLKDRNILVKSIVKDGKEQTVKFTAIDLQEALGYKTRQAASKHIMKLKSLNIVKGIKTKDFGYVFAINPNYYMNGTSVPKEISELFNEEN